MNQLCIQIALRLAAHVVCRALGVGLALGAVFWLICSTRPGDHFSYAMGVLVLASGAASFVLYTIGSGAAPRRPPRPAQVQDCVVALCFGMLVAVNGLELLLG